MSERPTIQSLIEMLTDMAARAPDDALLSINGEVVETFTVTLQNPLAKTVQSNGMVEVIRDRGRQEVLDISTNGREVRDLPRRDFGYIGLRR